MLQPNSSGPLLLSFSDQMRTQEFDLAFADDRQR